MARLIGPSEAARLAYTIPTSGTLAGVLKGKAGRPAKFYDDPDPTAEPTLSMLVTAADIRTLAGVPYADSTVTIDPVSQFPRFQFPDGTPPPDSLLGQIDGGPAFRVYASEDERLDALGAAVAAAQITASAAGTAAATAQSTASTAQTTATAAGTAAATAQTTANAAQTTANSAVPATRQITAGTGLTGGGTLAADRSLAVAYGTTAGTAAQGDDPRIVGAVPASTVDAKGDLLAGTADNVLARLAVGADGARLVADSAQAAGIRWSATLDVQGGSTSGTWTNPAPTVARPMLIHGHSAGSGGGTGRRGAAGSLRTAGAAGAAGCPFMTWALTTDFPASVPYTVGAGGAGAPAPAADNTDGSAGSTGGATFFGASYVTYCIGGINAGSTAGGRGGNAIGTATGGVSALLGPAGGASNATGGVGAVGGPPTLANGLPINAASAGGAGGGVSTGDVQSAGSIGGNMGAGTKTGGAAGAAGGGSGGPGDPTGGINGGLGGGGGGGNNAGGGGAGGDGGFPAAGGGGAGAGTNGTTGQPGGRGGDGVIRIVTFL